MREGLKRRIQGNTPATLSFIKKEYMYKNNINKRVSQKSCHSAGKCDESNQNNRKYYAPFRQPLKGYRKTKNGDGNTKDRCLIKTEIYKDSYTDCSNNDCTTKGSLSTTKLPTGNTSRATSGISTRSLRPLIRSGMQPNTAGQQNSGMTPNKNQYSYSYRELLNNRRKVTLMKKLPTQKPTGTTYMSNPQKVPGYGGNCSKINNCLASETVYRYNNHKFKVQGAVDASSRIDRLKLDTIRGSSRCASGKTGPSNNRSDCNGNYLRGISNSTSTNSWANANGSEYLGRKYTRLFNNANSEVNYPQTSALTRVRGAVSHKTTVNPNGGVCCNNDPAQVLS